MEGVNLDIKPDQMEGVNEKNSPSRNKEIFEMTPTKTFEIGHHFLLQSLANNKLSRSGHRYRWSSQNNQPRSGQTTRRKWPQADLLHYKTPKNHHQKSTTSWNFKKVNWEVYKTLADGNCKNINLEQHHLNKLTQLITEAILDAAKKSIPRGRRKQYTPGWNNQLQELHDAVSQARIAQEQEHTDANVKNHNKARAEFTQHKLH